MPAKPAQIAAGIAGALALATGGYFANEWRVCRGLHDDYINFAKVSLSEERLKSAVNRPDFDKAMKIGSDKRVMDAGQTLFDLKERCGEKARAEAELEAQDYILQSGPF